MERSKLDPSHISQITYDAVAKAVKVKIQDTEISMELNHQDGDSVTAHPAKLTASALGVIASVPEVPADPMAEPPTELVPAIVGDENTDIIPALDCSSLKEVRVDVDGTGTVKIWASPTDSGDFFYEVGAGGATLTICARRVKVECIDAVGDVHLVGRS